MKRLLDLTAAVILLLCLSLPFLIIALLIKFTSKGPIVYWSDRVGKNNVIFKMAKFRTMRVDTPVVATHLLQDASHYITPIGSFLREFSLDELPQIFNIISGEMSFVGPRPALFNQADLIALRTREKVHTLVPGVTGWAQINGRDELSIPAKVKFDAFYLHNKSLLMDARILAATIFKVIKREAVSH